MRSRNAMPRSLPISAAFSILALAAALAAACSGGADPDDRMARPEAADILSVAARRMETVRSFHFVLEHESGSSPIVLDLAMTRAEGDVVLPDRLRAAVSARIEQLGNARIEVTVVAVGEDAVISNPFQRHEWVPVPGTNPLADIFDPAQGATAVLKNLNEAIVTGEDSVDGHPVWVVEGPVDGGVLAGFTPNAEQGWAVRGIAWVDKEGAALRRIRLEGPLGPNDETGVVRVILFSRYDEPVNIELPN